MELVPWLLDPAHWSGSDGIPNRVLEHVQLSAVSTLAGLLVALPLGVVIGHTGRGTFLAVAVANIGRAIPSFALLVITLPLVLRAGLGLGFWPTVVPLVLLAIPPALTNAYVGIRQVDRDIVEAAQGMGMRGREILLGVEIPSALPVILAGARTAAVQVVATATLGAIVASGGLGRYIVDGLAFQETGRLLAGALLVALLAVATEQAFGLAEGRLVSRGVRVTTARGPRLAKAA
jgi:osmoprotectant transport system permease protein